MHLQCTKTDTHIGMKLVGRVGWVCNKHFNAVERDFFFLRLRDDFTAVSEYRIFTINFARSNARALGLQY